jgi:ribonuclease Z
VQVGGAANVMGPTVLLDCGEGAYAVMCTLLGKERAQASVDRLAAVWVSHKHADHCLGLPEIVSRRSQQRPALVLALPAAVWAWFSGGYPYLLDRVKYVHCARFSWGPCMPRSSGGCGNGISSCGAMAAAGFTSWQCVRVRHCFDAFGLVLEHCQGWKVVVSGDTQPCEQLVRAGAGATLLVHEATFSCDREADAAAKRHCTVGQALAVAERMGAWRVVLTHFSQRYSRYAPELDSLAAGAAARAVPVFDGVRVHFQDLWTLPLVTRALMRFATEGAEVAAGGDAATGLVEHRDCS